MTESPPAGIPTSSIHSANHLQRERNALQTLVAHLCSSYSLLAQQQPLDIPAYHRVSQPRLFFVNGAKFGSSQLLKLRVLLQLLRVSKRGKRNGQQLLVVVAFHHIILEVHGDDAEVPCVGLRVRVLCRVEDAVWNVYQIALVARVIMNVAVGIETVTGYGRERGAALRLM